MGHGIVKNLLAKGFEVSLTIHTRREPLQDLLAAGARVVDTFAELSDCDAVMLCVTGSPQVEAVVQGSHGLLRLGANCQHGREQRADQGLENFHWCLLGG